jgi:hypothetical protein
MRSKDWSLKDPLKAPRLATGHTRWIKEVLTSSSRYLERIFDVNSRTNTPALLILDMSQNITSLYPTPPPRGSPGVEVCLDRLGLGNIMERRPNIRPPTPCQPDSPTATMSSNRISSLMTPHLEAEMRQIWERARERRRVLAAAKLIQRIWRGYKIRRELTNTSALWDA